MSERTLSRSTERWLWIIALLTFGVADVVTSSIGLWMAGVIELHPFAPRSFYMGALGWMVTQKGIALAGCLVLWRLVPRPHCIGVPLGLVTLGLLITGWNAQILLRVQLG